MPIVRILVDGYSLLHEWPELAPGAARHSAAARDALIQVLTQYRDATHTPITVFFDGQGAPPGTPKPHSGPDLEVIFSGAGKTADDLIERVAYRLKAWGEVLVVSNDRAERDLVSGFGGLTATCPLFMAQVRGVLQDLDADVRLHNRREAARYRNGGR
jgi:predicted RNA-binding protein with PIN domain